MHRLTARVLLTLLLMGTLAPLALAIAAPAPHACCMRKPMHGAAPTTEIYAPLACCGHDCCRTLTIPQWAHATLPAGARSLTTLASVESVMVLNEPLSPDAGRLSARAPPPISIA